MTSMTEKELLELKEEIDSAKTQLAELSGQEKYLRERLKKEWGCSSIKEAEKKLGDLSVEVDALETKYTELSAQIREKYNV